MSFRGLGASFYVRAGAVIAASTVLLTASFVGVVGLLDRGAAELGTRLPFYVLAMAVVFVASLLVLDDEDVAGTSVIGATVGIAVTAFIVVGLAGEGALYALDDPGEVLGSNLIAYFVAAGLICTGLTYWGLNHWREYTGVVEIEEA